MWQFLPDEIYVNDIFPWLGIKDLIRASLVNHLWNRLCWEKRTQIDLVPVFNQISDAGLCAILTASQKSLKTIKFSRYPHQIPMQTWLKFNPLIQSMSFRNCPNVDPIFLDISIGENKFFKNVTYLDVTGSHKVDLSIHCLPTTLTYLSLNCCTKIANTSLATLATRCTSLKTIILKGCYKLTKIDPLLQYCPQLEELNLSKLKVVVNSSLFLNIAKYCKNITSLNVVGCNVKDEDIKIITFVLGKKLKKMILKFCDEITNIGISQLCQSSPNLEVLDLQGISKLDDTLTPYLALCENLRLLDIRDCPSIGHLELIAKNCPYLEEVRLRSDIISDTMVNSLVSFGKNLRVVDLQACHKLTLNCLLPLVSCIWPYLILINLTYIPLSEEDLGLLRGACVYGREVYASPENDKNGKINLNPN